MSKRFEADEFVKDVGEKIVYLIKAVESRSEVQENMDRYTLQGIDGSLYYNRPGYLLVDATEQEVQAALDAARKG